jgi:hypothetical protein
LWVHLAEDGMVTDLLKEVAGALFLAVFVGFAAALGGFVAVGRLVLVARALPAGARAAVVRGVHQAGDLVHGVADMIAEP